MERLDVSVVRRIAGDMVDIADCPLFTILKTWFVVADIEEHKEDLTNKIYNGIFVLGSV